MVVKIEVDPSDNNTIAKDDVPPEYISEEFSLSSDLGYTPLPLWRKLAYSAGGIPMQLAQNVIAFFLPIYFLETAELSPFYLSAVQIVARGTDAISDPIVGYLVLRTKQTKLGRKRPW